MEGEGDRGVARRNVVFQDEAKLMVRWNKSENGTFLLMAEPVQRQGPTHLEGRLAVRTSTSLGPRYNRKEATTFWRRCRSLDCAACTL